MRCGCLPPESSVSTISSFAVEITAILLSTGIPTQTSPPSGEIVIASAPFPIGITFTAPVARSIALTLPEIVFVT